MARSRRLRRGGLLGSLAQRAATAYVKNVALPVTKYAVNQAVNRSGLANDPRYQAAQAVARDAKSAWSSPTGQALRGQATAYARQALAPPAPASPYGRSAVPVAQAVPMARPVPVAQPVAPAPAPPAATPPGPDLPVDPSVTPMLHGFNPRLVSTLAGAYLWSETDPAFRAKLAKRVGERAVYYKKNSAWNKAVQDGMRALGADVARLVKEGVQPGPTSFRGPEQNGETAADLLADLTNGQYRSAVADSIVRSARDPTDQRFLPGAVNQVAAAVLGELQRVAYGGRKTRRGRKVRRTTRRA